MGQAPDRRSYDVSTFEVLAYKFPGDDPKAAERKIKSMLHQRKLGEYDQLRIDRLRSLKNELQAEIEQAKRSKYFVKREGAFAAAEDFDINRILKD